MSSVSSIALSGLNAASLRLSSSAHNIANAQTPGFRRQDVVQQALPQGGVEAMPVQSAQVGDALAEDIVNQLAASADWRANVAVLRSEKDRLGTLLDLTA